jgi:hypothetical protein
MILIFDDQNCLLQIAFKNNFDTITFISNGDDCLFDDIGFRVFTSIYLNFPGNCREKQSNGIKQSLKIKKLGIFGYEDMEARARYCSAPGADLDSCIIVDLFFTIADGWFP